MQFAPKPRLFTVAEYRRMADLGVLRNEERVELLDGTIIEMSPIGQRHWATHGAIVRYLSAILGDAAFIGGQTSIALGGHSEPQPDIAILAPRAYRPPHLPPSPAELYAVIELSDSSLATDLGVKLHLYARFAIRDYLVVDLRDNVLLHHSAPHDLGYRVVERRAAGDSFTLAALPQIRLDAAPFLSDAFA